MKPPRPRDQAIIAARERGLPVRAIADALGISQQAVSQRLRRYGIPEPPKVRRKSTAVKVPVTCPQCGRVVWKVPGRAHFTHCSRRCAYAKKKLLTDEGVAWAIEMRLNGAMTWTTIGRRLGFPIQTVQARIWRHLHRSDLLTLPIVSNIWKRTTSEFGRTASWAWLERTIGPTLRP